MNRKSYTAKQSEQDKSPFFVVEKKEKMSTSAEVTMSDIAKKLYSVYAQMQMKHSPRHVTSQNFVEENFKSYLDDISRAILTEHYMRRQKEKKLFEYLEQIKMLIQNLHSEKKSLEEAMITRRMARSKSFDSVVQKLAVMGGEEKQKCSLLQEESNFSKRNGITPSQNNCAKVVQQTNKNSLPKDSIQCFSKEAEEIVENSTAGENRTDVQAVGHCCENDSASPLKMKSQKTFFFLGSSLKIFFRCFLIIAFLAVIALCFYSFLREPHFFNLWG
ncbi:hypothetical protein [Bartonella birtlesii]|uniref:hypothetical protein n=2 Tax=Bartonella birtlesii TaxID=111504 RepID=UPI0004235342|nr:hypothetical protein [Bartonella birtlesii]